jgi:hypothetical protein
LDCGKRKSPRAECRGAVEKGLRKRPFRLSGEAVMARNFLRYEGNGQHEKSNRQILLKMRQRNKQGRDNSVLFLY